MCIGRIMSYTVSVYLGLGVSFICISYVCVHRGLAAGIYATNNAEACHFVADNCKANVIVVENQKQLDKILEVSVAVTEAYFLYLTS